MENLSAITQIFLIIRRDEQQKLPPKTVDTDQNSGKMVKKIRKFPAGFAQNLEIRREK